MADEPVAPQPAPVAETPVAPAIQYQVPADYEELKAYRAQAEGIFEKWRPYEQRFAKIVEDERYRKAIDNFDEQYTKASTPEVDPYLQPVIAHIDEKLAPVEKTIQRYNEQTAEYEKQQAAEQNRKAKESYDRDLAYGQRLMVERPDLVTNNGAGITRLVRYARANDLALEDAWKDLTGLTPEKEKPPKSLRAEAHTPGVPGKSDAKSPATKEEFRAEMRRRAKVALGG
jgi:hypothetical protein